MSPIEMMNCFLCYEKVCWAYGLMLTSNFEKVLKFIDCYLDDNYMN